MYNRRHATGIPESVLRRRPPSAASRRRRQANDVTQSAVSQIVLAAGEAAGRAAHRPLDAAAAADRRWARSTTRAARRCSSSTCELEASHPPAPRPSWPAPCRWPPSTRSAWATWASTSSASRAEQPERQGPRRVPAPRPGLRAACSTARPTSAWCRSRGQSRKLTVLPWREEEMVLACAPRHPLARQPGRARRRSWTAQKYVDFDRTWSSAARSIASCASRASRVEVVLEFDNIENIKKAVEIGAGVALLPEPTLRREVQAGTLVGRAAGRLPAGAAARHHPPPAAQARAPPPGASSTCCRQTGDGRRRRPASACRPHGAGDAPPATHRGRNGDGRALAKRTGDHDAHTIRPAKQGLYDPQYEHDACGVGFVVDLKGRKSHDIVEQGASRSCSTWSTAAPAAARRTPATAPASSCRCRTASSRRSATELGITLPGAGRVRRRHGLPADRRRRPRSAASSCSSRSSARRARRSSAGATCRPTTRCIGPTAQAAEPVIRQIFIGQRPAAARLGDDALAFERKLYVIRKRVENAVAGSEHRRSRACSTSRACRTRRSSTRACSTPTRSPPTIPDLHDPAVETALALVHSRFSTNTFPNWARAHPYRYLAHNGEINTLRGNVNWMHARESLFALASCSATTSRRSCRSSTQTGSDSAMFDNALELLVLTGRSLPHAVMMMIPEPWSGDATMSAGEEGVLRVPRLPDGAVGRPGVDRLHRRHAHRRRARPQRPAAVALLRHQGRPGHHGLRGRRARRRRRRTSLLKGRLQPGRMFLVDLEQGRIIADDELKQQIATRAALRRVAATTTSSRWRTCPRRRRRTSRITRPCCSASRRSATRTKTCKILHGADGHRRQRGDRLDGQRRRRWPCSRTGRSCSTTTSSSSSPRSPTRRSTASAKRSSCRWRRPSAAECNLLEPTPRVGPADQAEVADPDERGAGQAAPARRHSGRHGFKSITLPILFPVDEGAERAGTGAGRAVPRRPARPSPTATTFIILSDRGIDARPRRRSRRCWPSPACTTT